MSRPLERPDLGRRLAAEAVGTAFLLATVVGSGIMGERLRGGQCGGGIAREYPGDGRRARRAHPDVRADLRRSLQPGRHAGRCLPGRLAVARRAGLRGRADRRGLRRRGRGEHHVRAAAVLCLAPRAPGPAQMFSEFVATFGLLAVIWGCARLRSARGALRGGRLYHRRVLVHRVDVVRQSRR